ncbi:Uncharacterised protein [Candidatus Gugararchaeum adminiculabundum]|nr:Uncharacterised protein [Candidatus Gugararchaeum adminiculabundum]
MRLRKGSTAPSSWIWIIGGLILAVITIAIVWQLFANMSLGFARNNARSEFQNFVGRVESMCSSVSVGSKMTFEMKLPNVVEAAYASISPGFVPGNITEFVGSPYNTGGVSNGDYVCMKLQGETEPRCEKLDCDVTMNYLGTPPAGSFFDQMQRAAGSQNFEYEITIEKQGSTIMVYDKRK